MGIQGLLPFVKKSTKQAHVREFKGCTVGVDAYVWLHKGAFACAEKLAKGEKTNQYVTYCMKYVGMLISHGIKPILVFDGQRLPSKAFTERKRRENRSKNLIKAKEFLREGKLKEARECFQRCVDVTSAMALDLIKTCISCNVDCIVAPYEADAQLAYLNLKGIIDLVITEDSDLLAFGCNRVLFKMDVVGNGFLVEQAKLGLSLQGQAHNFSTEKFRRMCIMSGCDYLPSLPGIGLGKAFKFFSSVTNPNLTQILYKIPSYLKMPQLEVTSDYVQSFVEADNTFVHQLVYDPLQRQLIPLTPYPPGISATAMPYAGAVLEPATAFQLAIGNLDVNTLERMDSFHPDQTIQSRSRNNHSIWSRSYEKMPLLVELSVSKDMSISKSVNAVVSVSLSKTVNTVKRKREEVLEEIANVELTASELCTQYLQASNKSPVLKRRSYQEKAETIVSTPVARRCNPFAKSVRKIEVEETNCVVVSPYFASKSTRGDPVEKKVEWLDKLDESEQLSDLCPANYELLGDCGIKCDVVEETLKAKSLKDEQNVDVINIQIDPSPVKDFKKTRLGTLKSKFPFSTCKELYPITASPLTQQPFKCVVSKSNVAETVTTSLDYETVLDYVPVSSVELLTPPATQSKPIDEKDSGFCTSPMKLSKSVTKSNKRQLNLKDMFAFRRSESVNVRLD